MRAGALDRTIVIERATTTINEVREKVQTWAPILTLRAQRLLNETVDRTEKGVAMTMRTATFRTRFVDMIGLNDRVSFEGVPWIIKDIQEVGRREALEIKVERTGQ